MAPKAIVSLIAEIIKHPRAHYYLPPQEKSTLDLGRAFITIVSILRECEVSASEAKRMRCGCWMMGALSHSFGIRYHRMRCSFHAQSASGEGVFENLIS
jgi:hypothetical protein